MARETINKGEQLYLAAMAKGGGSHDRQADNLLALSTWNFLLATGHIHNLLGNNSLLERTSVIVNRTHESFNLYKNTQAPTNINPNALISDITETAEHALDRTYNPIKFVMICAIIVRGSFLINITLRQ